MTRRVQAIEDPSLSAVVVSRAPLSGVRAGSGLAWMGDRLAVIQDDAPAVALVDPETLRIEHRALPAGGWDKATKLDLEACVADGSRLVAFGSGSTPARERIAIVDGDGARVVEAPAFYAALRACGAFSGSELNVEGAVLLGGHLRLFQRGNGAPKDGRTPIDATCEIGWPFDLSANVAPVIHDVVQYDLGGVGGVRLTFTDAAVSPSGVFYLAVAEDSPDTVQDGPVSGVAFGRIEPDGTARWSRLCDSDGRPFIEKAEGLAVAGSGAWIVLDRDDPDAPAELCRVALEGL